jgi:uncharacterized membrane protein
LERQRTEIALAAWSRTFSGPLPPPETLGQYEERVPGSAERIIAMAERQATHRQSLEKKIVDAGCQNERFGQILAAGIAVTGIIVGAVLVSQGKSLAGFTAMLGPLAAIVALFFYGKHQQQRRLNEKREALVASLRPPPSQPQD